MKNIREQLDQLIKEGWTWEELLQLSNLIVVEEENSRKVIEKDKEESDLVKVSTLLKQIGVAVHIKGYGYLRDSILMCLDYPETIYEVTKKLYPGVAEKNNSTASKVERSIRHAIERLWNINNNSILIEKIFGFSPENNTRKKPTNSEFIATIVEYLKIN